MKKFTMFMALLLLISWQGMAQISTYYSFSELNSPYVDITGGTIDLVADSDDGEVLNVPIGFSYNYAGTLYSTVTIGVNGALSFSSNDVSFTNTLSATGATQTNVIAPLWDDMYFRTVDNAEIMYLTTGTTPNRVFTVQWKNISWRNAGNTVNFQVQLFENTNNIQFNYGVNSSTDTRTASIGFNKGTSGTDFISVTPGTPATSSFITDDNNINTTQYPGNGAVYLFTFTPPACPDPSALSATNLTATSADLAWTEMGSATTWDIEWGTAGFTPTGTPNIVGTTTNPHNLTGLTAQTDYDFYVRSDCAGNGLSGWSGPYTFTTPCVSQLAGTYTIGATGNYATFTDAVNALSCGVSAPVIFNVLTGSGPYNEQVTITPVTGASATNTITFNGNGETITSTTATSSRSLILLDGADYITINDLVLVPQSTTNNFTVQLTNDADFNTINNCTVDLTAAISSTSTTNAGIVISGSLTSATSTLASGSNNTISNNTVIGGYYAITLAGANNNMVTNNDVQDFYLYGVYHNTANNNEVKNNTISRPNRTSVSTFYGIYYTGSGENNLAEANEIFNPMGGNTTSTSSIYPIYHTGVDATVGNENKVINNIIHSVNGNGTIYGLYNLSSDGVFYYHNTVSLDDANATSGTTRGFYQTTTATGIEFKNNIITVTRGGTGTKHCIYFNAAASTITSDNNVFYINAPAGTNDLGYFSATNQATLVDWQTASSQDASSSDADPIYANILSNDLTPTNAAIDGMADATVGVANDFYGVARAVTPDPGAIEFMPPSCAQPSNLVVTNITNSSADLAWTENGTATMWDIEWGTAGFTPTGTPTIVGTTTNPHSLTGLTDLTTYDFYVRADCGGTESAWSGPFSFTTTCGTQLAGNYTIGATGTYPTFTDAVNALLACGISAPVVFDVLIGSGPYNEQVTITPVTGASATNTITFNGNGETITSATATGSRSLILLDGADYITINDLVLVPQSTTNNFTVQLTNDADFNTINNCTVDLTAAISSTSTTNAGIVISGSLTSATSTLASGSNNTISNNTVIGGYYAITLAGANNNMVTNNDVQDVYYYGIYHSAVNNTNTSNNKVSRPNRTSVSTTAYYAIYYTGSSENNLTDANELFNPLGSTTSTPTTYLIGHSSVDATVGNENIVTNNIIHSVSGNATVYGLYNSGSDGVFYYHNTVSLDDANATSGTTRGFYQTTTATGIEFKNNIITITRGGTGTKYCIYFNATASTIASDNNVFYINAPAGTNNLGYSGGAQATLVDWQTASSQDASSSDADPLYVNILANNLTPSNAAIDGMADASVGVANDFYGTARAVTPDPGAIEFMPPACPAPSALTATNITATSADLGWTENGTATTWDIEWGTAGFTPTGTPTIVGTTTNPHNLTGLTAQTSYDFYVRADCGGSGTSTWSGPFTFSTECAAVVAPWVENFENAGAIPACWSQGASNAENWLFDNSGSGTYIGNGGVITGTTTSGNFFAWVDDSTPHSATTTLESPFIDVTALTNPMLSFFLISDNEGNSNVDFSVDVWDGAVWNTGVYTSNTNTLNGGWEQINVYLNSLTITGDIKLRFIVDENNGTDFYDDVAIDDVEIKEAPSCPDPSALTATNITATSADLAWTENGTATMWDIEWGTAGFTPTGTPTIVGTTTNPHNLTGLTAQTSYDFYVRADCGGSGTSTWSGPFTFSTECAAVVAPWVENFENAGAIPACWSQGASNGEDWLFDNSGSGTYIGNGGVITGTTTSGNFFAWVDDSTPHSATTTLESPFIDVTALTNPMLSFFLISDNEGNSNVDFSVDVWDGAAWNTGVYTSNTNTLNGGWEQINVYLSSLTITGDIRLRFIVDENNGTDFYDDVAIDDVEIKEAPPCPAPSALTATNITATSADLGWTENGTATTWDIEWGTTGFTPTGTPTIVGTTTNPHSLTGLTANTAYEFYVRAMCSASDSSAWVGPFAFATICNTVTTFPFLEDFETTSTTRDCWSQIEEVGTASWTYATGSTGGAISTAYSGTENAQFVSQSGTNSPIVKLVSPVLDLSSVNNPELAFFYGQEVWFSDQNELKVYYRTSTAGAWTQIAHYTADVAVWTADTLTLPNPSATYQIAFEGINNWGRANVVDDVEIYDAITCSDPSNLTAFNIQPTSAMLDWTENGTATNWNIEWDVTGFTLGTGNPQAVAAKPYLLQGLTPNTSYDYYVQADCGSGDTSNWVGPYTFATPPCMPIVVDLGSDTIVCSKDSILLDAGAGGNYSYSWSTGGSAQTELIDTTLMGGNGTYNVSVTVTDNISGCIYTDDINITFQLCTDIDELGNKNAISIYPNPTKGLLNVMINETTTNTMLTIVDVQGKVVYNKNNFTNSTSLVETIDLSGNDKGIYFITLTTDKTTVVKKVILH